MLEKTYQYANIFTKSSNISHLYLLLSVLIAVVMFLC